jgi:hypothetical protein
MTLSFHRPFQAYLWLIGQAQGVADNLKVAELVSTSPACIAVGRGQRCCKDVAKFVSTDYL